MAQDLTTKQRRVTELGQQLKVGDLQYTHPLYDRYKADWDFMLAVFEGIREIVRMGLIVKHEREPQSAYDRRLAELYSLGYSCSVVEIFQHFLFKKNPQDRQLGPLHEDKLWKQFYDDADLYGNGYEATLMEIALYAGVLGHMGILVDKAKGTPQNRAEEIEKKVYPYMAKYFPQAILDWDYAKDEFNRPYLNYLKLLDDDGQYRIWSPERWEIWEMPKDKDGKPDTSNSQANADKVDDGENRLREIPFVWHYNFKSRHRCVGKSDVSEIARIDLSIVRNLSQIEEIINFAAFPMMRKPMRDAKPTDINAPQQDDEVSTQAVLEFDPENPESKPDWLESKVRDAVDATWSVITGKIGEIYRAANIGGLASTEPTKEPQSGVAKQTDFQMLNAKLVNKAINLENTENWVVELWLKWQSMWDSNKDKVRMSRPKTYDIENLANDLANALTAKTIVVSRTFNKLVQQQTARQVLPGASEQELADIDNEIEENLAKREESKPTPPDQGADQEDQPFIQDAMAPDNVGSLRAQGGQNQQGQQEGGDANASGDEGA